MAEELGITVKKNEDFSEWFSQVIQKADLADIRFGVQGFIVQKPNGFFILRRIYEMLEEEIEKDEHQAFLFPSVVKEESLMKEKEHAGFTPEVFWVSEAGTKKIEERFALRPTGEAQIYPMYSLWIRSYNDLPYKAYQSRISVFRNEMTTRPYMRGREFAFFEAHDVFANHNEAMKQVRKDVEISKKVIYDQCKIPFLFFRRPQWDKFLGADDTYVPDTLMPDGRRNQLASTHDLGQNFAKAYDIKFEDRDGKEKLAWQTCYGPGVWRIAAAIIGIHGDDKGLVLPFSLASTQVVIVPILFSKNKMENQKVVKKCMQLKDKLPFRVKFDNTEENPGFKYNKYEMLGVPIRLEIGPREVKEGKVTLARRDGKKRSVLIKNLEKEIFKDAEALDRLIKRRADDYFKGNTRNAKTLKELKSLIGKHKGFVKIPFCSVDVDGKKCADVIKDKTSGGYVCGTLYPKEEKALGKCAVCGKKANHMVYVAKSY